jgi:TP901 family phage tail tape measure protein
MSKETLEAAGASAQLAAKISTQETVLKNLEQGYADYIVTGQEGTEEAEQLASTIQELSGELTENRGTLDAAEKAARALSETMDDAGGEAETLRSTISKQEDTLQQLKQRYVDVATEQGETSDEARELARQIQDLSSELHENKTKLSDAEYAADKLDNSLEEVESSAKKADDGFTMFKATLANLAADAIMRAVDGIKNLVGNVIELGQNFTSTMSEVSAISGATGEDFEKLEACAREYGATTVFSASNAAEALKYMSLAGWDADQSTSALGGVLNLAAASGMELGAASDMVTDYLSAFAMEAGDAAYFADLLSYAQSHSNTTAEALGEAYKNCAANLNAAGQDVETVTSLLEGMANQGYKGSEAGTAMAAIMRDITNGMKDGAIKIGETSVAVMDAQGNFRDLTDILTEVEAATNGMGDAERAVALSSTFTADSTKGLNLILNEGMGNIAGYEEELRGASGSAEEMANIMNDNLSGDVAAMNSAFEELGLKIYDALESKLRAGVQFITNGVIPAIEWLGGHIPEVTIAVSGLGAVIAAMNWGTISSKIAMVKGALVKLAAALGGVSLPAIAIIAVITAVALAFTNLWKNNEEFRNKITAIWDGIKAKFDEFGQGIVDRLNALGFEFEDITEVMKAVWDGFCEVLAPIFEGVFQQISNILNEALDILTGLFDIFAGIFTGDWDMVWQGVQEVFGAVWDFVVATFENWISTFTSLADTVLGWFGTDWETVWTNVKTFFSDTWNAISSFFSGILTGIKTFFTDTWNAIVSFFSGIYSSVTGTMTEIHDTFTNIWDSITGFLSGAWETIKNIVTVGIMAVKEIISAAFQIITLPFRFIWENCKDTVLSIWETIKSVIGEKIDAVKEKITTVTTAISNVASAAWNAISSTASSLWEGIKGTIGSKIDAAKEKVSTATSTITSVASSAWSSVSSTASSLWSTISSTVSSKISAASSAVSSATSTITSVASSAWSSVSSAASSKWESVRSTISSKLSSAQSTVSSLMSGITSTMSSGLSSALSTVSGKFSSIYSTISSKMSAARDAVGNAISALKSKFNFSWSLPHLKLPHVSISGSFSINPPSVPHFGISWYKDGGILTRPTIFGAAGNNLLAGGEAGAEAVVPLATLWDKLETMITSVFNTASTTGGSSGEGLTSTAGRLLTLDDFSLGSLADSGGVVVYYDFSGFTWSPQIQTEGTGDDADDFMAKLKAHEAEFFDWLEEFIKMREVAQYA